MGKIFQAAMSVADADKISISMWVRINSASLATATTYDSDTLYYVPLLEFGEFGFDNSYASSGIWAGIPTDLSFISLKAAVAGNANSVNYTSCLAGNWDNNEQSAWTSGFDYTYQTGDGSPGNPVITHTVGVPAGSRHGLTTYGAAFFPRVDLSTTLIDKLDTWIHIFVAFDTSTATVPTTGPGISTAPSGHFVVNGTNIGPFDPSDTQARLMPSYAVLAAEGITPIDSEYNILQAATGLDGGGASATDTSGFTAEDGATPNPFPGGVVSLTVPAFDIALNANKLGVPGVFFDNSVVQYADVQIWVDQFIDGPTEIAKFLTITDTIGKPTNPAVSKAAFGNRTFEFVKGKTIFPVNGGTGGSFTKTGTIDDVVGSPSCVVTP